jgi:uncharacterized LabA/DUF88 family protein|tara:strand:+ start:87 stop:626 length:540 start_codon:yes stop_codon:yes gene_type:complete
MRVALFIDGNNFYHGLRNIYEESKKLINFDFKKFSDILGQNNRIVVIFYYNAKLDKIENTSKFISQERFFSKLRRIDNFNLILCRLLKRKIRGTNNYYYVLKEDDIHMAVDMVEGAFDNKFDIAIVVSGDGDFVPAVRAVQRRSKKVINAYFKKSSSINLQHHCDESIQLTKDLLDKCF